MKELVSVIMPTYNASQFLADSIESVLSQTYAELELLITDDNSSDPETLSILERYRKHDSRVRVFHLDANGGPGVARNNSIRNARGRYIAFCDSDDRWVADKLERQVSYMQQTGCALCCSSYIICDTSDEELGICITPKEITFKTMVRDNKVGCLTAIYDRKALGRKFYMPTIRKRQDWGLFLSIVKVCGYAHGITEPLAYYRVRKGSVSQSKLHLIKYNARVYEQILGFSKPKSYVYFFFVFMPNYAMKVLKRQWDSYRFVRSRRAGK